LTSEADASRQSLDIRLPECQSKPCPGLTGNGGHDLQTAACSVSIHSGLDSLMYAGTDCHVHSYHHDVAHYVLSGMFVCVGSRRHVGSLDAAQVSQQYVTERRTSKKQLRIAPQNPKTPKTNITNLLNKIINVTRSNNQTSNNLFDRNILKNLSLQMQK